MKVGSGIDGRFEYEYEYRCTEYEYERGHEFPMIPGLRLAARVVLVLVLSIAVLVLDSIRASELAHSSPKMQGFAHGKNSDKKFTEEDIGGLKYFEQPGDA